MFISPQHDTTDVVTHVDTEYTTTSFFVYVSVEPTFRMDCEVCYAALNDALRPYGGTAAFDLWSETHTLVICRKERE